MSIAEEVFEKTVRPLPIREQIRIASLILKELAQNDVRVIDLDDKWSEEDERDLTAFSLRYAESIYPEGVELV